MNLYKLVYYKLKFLDKIIRMTDLAFGTSSLGVIIPGFTGYKYLIREKKVFNAKSGKFIKPKKSGKRLQFTLRQNGKPKIIYEDKIRTLVTGKDELPGNPIPSFPKYSIVNNGDIYNINTKKKLKASLDGGYHRIILRKDGGYHHCYIHRLVGETYIHNPHKYPVVNHKDGNPLNNNVENLEWLTVKLNTEHAYKIGLNKRFKRAVIQFEIIEKKTNDVKLFDNVIQASNHTKIPVSKIYLICRTEKKYKGFLWRYTGQRKGSNKEIEITRLTHKENIIRRFESAADARSALGIHNTTMITRVCKNKGKFAAGYQWRYETERNNQCNSEKWKKIPGFSKYKISKNGDVYTTFQNRKLSLYKSKNGYLSVHITRDDGKRKNMKVHRLVCLAYSENIEKKTVNHKDGKKDNNNYKNLEWATYLENNMHSIKTGLRKY